MTTFTQTDKAEITELLVGRRVTKVSDNTLVLDDGRRLEFEGHDGGCACSAGCYDLTALNGVENIITGVTFEDSPGGDAFDTYKGFYRIFVFADNRTVNLATFEGTDGNGYYRTGYSIRVISDLEVSQ